jgi:rhodanese-related sulfurtransferase
MKTYILDVRSPDEYKAGCREGAINLPMDELFENSEYAVSILKNITEKLKSYPKLKSLKRLST